MSERITNSTLRNSLLNEEEYAYAHLVKFEKPRPSSQVGSTSGKATDYSYITDGSVNITWDDGSVDSLGNLNQAQTYVANKLLSVGTVQETTEARASNMSLVLDGTAFGTIITATVTFTSSTTMNSNVDLYSQAFQEGDTLYIEGGVNDGKYITIKKFSNDNKTISFYATDTIQSSAGAELCNLSFASEELTALIRNKNIFQGLSYSSYINREVFIYRAHLNPETGSIIGEPFLIFKGIISKGSIKENPEKSTKVTWSLTSHWGDFVRVQGRITSDPYHRALTVSGTPDIDALLNPAYATDYGFMHAETAVNVTGIYQAQETRYKMKKRGGLAGALGGKKLVEYEVTVDREVDLQFNLSAKYLPVVYGVQKVDSIPVFSDTLLDDPAKLYIAYAICEGEIGGIYDIHIDDNTTVCIDKSDADVRVSGDVDVLCNGRADRGDVLAAASNYLDTGTNVSVDFGAGTLDFNTREFDVLDEEFYESNIGLENNAPGGQGLTHETSFTFTTPIDANFTIHTGKSDQKANQTLVKLAAENKFKIQNDYFNSIDDARPYWSASHRLLDTAYAVAGFTLSEGEVTIPKYEFVVRGRTIDCYNYDGSYKGSGVHSNFNLGDTVSLYNSSNVLIQGNVRIIDKWSFYNANGGIEYRFIFNQPLNSSLGGLFYMKNGSGDSWTFYKWDYKASENLPLAGAAPTATISSASYNSAQGTLQLTLSSPTSLVENILTELGNSLKIGVDVTNGGVQQHYSTFSVSSYNSTSNVISINYAYHKGALLKAAIDEGSLSTLIFKNILRLNSSSSSSNGAYVGQTISVYQYIDGIRYEKDFKIQRYDGGLKTAALSTYYDISYAPNSSYSYDMGSSDDKRVSINPAMQLLDYLTDKRYGKGLSLEKDIDLDSFKQAALLCDTTSDVTVITTQSAQAGEVYRYVASGRLIFEGTVKANSVLRSLGGTTYYETTFTDVIGKLAYKWSDWRVFSQGDLYWYNGKVYIASSGGSISSAPTGGSISSLSLAKVGGGSLGISITDGYTSSGNPIVKKYTSSSEGFNSPGYSLYDSDDVKYWKYVGWDEPEQRYVTRHQLNQVINTSTPVFDNINSMLIQFNGILRYSNGKYVLGVEQAAPSLFETYETISQDDIIGDISIDDNGQKESFNSMSANIIDPANKYAARSISFFNSEYLKEDKGIRKQGNFAMPGISNYYNARLNIKQYLDESRYGITIKFTLDSKGYLLAAGSIILISHNRFLWDNKLFRVSSINFSENGLVDIVADEHNNDAYLIDNIRSSLITSSPNTGGPSQFTISPPVPNSVEATADGFGGIVLTWENSAGYDPSTHYIQIWRSPVETFIGQAELLAIVEGNRYVDVITERSAEDYYYWINYFVYYNSTAVFSEFEPRQTDPGVLGSYFLAASVSVKLEATDYSVVYDESGLNPVFTSDGQIPAEGENGNIGLTATAVGLLDPLYKFTVNGISTNWQVSNLSTYSVPGYSQGADIITVSVAEKPQDWQGPGVLDPLEEDIVTADTISIIKVKEGSNALTVLMSNDTHTVASNNEGANADLTGSGTTIEVIEGVTPLTSVATSATLEAGQYKLSVDPTVSLGIITPGTVDVSGTNLVVSDHSGMNTDQVVITYSIEGLRLDGVTTFTFTKIQTISKARAGLSGSSTTVVDVFLLTNESDAAQLTLPTPTTNYKYDFTTGKLLTNAGAPTTTLDNNWKTTASSVTSTNKYLWMISEGVQAASGATIDEEVTFTGTPVLVSVYGETIPPVNKHLIKIYNLNNTPSPAPNLPSQDVIYNFSSTSFITGTLNNGWSLSASSISPTNKYLWESNVVVSSTEDEIIIAGTDSGPTDWDAPILSSVYSRETVVADLSNEHISVTADNNGDNPNLTGATTTLSIFIGDTNDVDNWTIATSKSDNSIGIAGANTKTITVTTMGVDEGTITFTASKAGYSDVSAIFTIQKVRAAVNGDPATVYRLIPSASVVRKSLAGAYTPSSISASAQSITGNQAPAAYTGGTIKIYKNATGAAVVTSSSGESSAEWQSIASDTTSIRIDLEINSVVVDTETIPVVLDGPKGADAVIADLSNEHISVTADNNGDNPNLTGATTTLSIFIGGTNDVDNWTIVTSKSDNSIGITGANTKTITVTAMGVDEGTITFTASKAGYSDVSAIFTIQKVRAAVNGDPATVYSIIPVSSVIGKDSAGNFTPSSFSADALSVTGNNNPVAYTQGTLKLYKNGGTTAVATSSENASTVSWTIESDTTSVKAALEVGGVVVDSETVPVVTDGAKGDPGLDPITVDLDNEHVSVTADNNGDNPNLTGAATNLTIRVGPTDDTHNWAITTAPSTGITISGENTRGIAVTGMTVDDGTVTFTATKTINSVETTVSAVFTIQKVRAAENGTPATVYRLITGSSSVRVSNAGTFSPNAIIANAQSITGNNVPVAYTEGTLKVYRNGGTTAVATSTAGSGNISWTITSGTTSAKVDLEVGGVVVDTENIPVIIDGTIGTSNAIVRVYSRNDSGSTPPNAPTTGQVTYTFGTGITENNLGPTKWEALGSITTIGAYLWEREATASGGTATVDIAAASFGAAQLIARDGDSGTRGRRTVQGYLYYEKTTAGAPNAPTGNTYTFSEGKVSGTGIDDNGDTNVWKNTPNEQNPASTNTHYTIRYYGTEATTDEPAPDTMEVSYSTAVGVPYTNFSGVVTFSGGTFSQDGGDITTIDGKNIATGSITANQIDTRNLTIKDSNGNVIISAGQPLTYDNLRFVDGFSYPNTAELLAKWTNYGGTGESSLLSGGGTYDSKYLRIGNNSGNDTLWYVYDKSFIYNPSKLYRIKVRARQVNGSGVAYFGVAGRNADDSEFVNTSGSDTHTGQHYFAATAVDLSTSWTEFTGYFGYNGFGTGYSPNYDSPGALHPNAKYFRPLILVNYNGVAGTTDIDYIRIEEVVGHPESAAKAAVSNISIGGAGDVVLLKNTEWNGTANNGEIQVTGSTFYHPNGTKKTIATQKVITTNLEASCVQDRFFIFYTETNVSTRFPSADTYTSTTGSEQFFAAVYDDYYSKWFLIDNTNNRWAFTPAETDCIVAVGSKTTVGADVVNNTGIDTLLSMIATNTNLPEDGADVINTQENGVTRIANPIGGSYSNDSSSVTGAIVVRLPQGFTNTMMSFQINVYDYEQNKSFTLFVSGYNYSTGWTRTSVNMVGNTAADNRVRFGTDDTGKAILVIGETTSTWSIPKVSVTNWVGGYSNFDLADWRSGWNILIANSIPGFALHKDYSDALLDANAIKNQGTLATSDSADWASQVGGSGKPANNADVTANSNQNLGWINDTTETNVGKILITDSTITIQSSDGSGGYIDRVKIGKLS